MKRYDISRDRRAKAIVATTPDTPLTTKDILAITAKLKQTKKKLADLSVLIKNREVKVGPVPEGGLATLEEKLKKANWKPIHDINLVGTTIAQRMKEQTDVLDKYTVRLKEAIKKRLNPKKKSPQANALHTTPNSSQFFAPKNTRNNKNALNNVPKPRIKRILRELIEQTLQEISSNPEKFNSLHEALRKTLKVEENQKKIVKKQGTISTAIRKKKHKPSNTKLKFK